MIKKHKKALLGCSVLSAVMVVAIGADVGNAGIFDANNYFYVPTHVRFFSIAISGGIGFGLGWFLSPQAKIYRKMITLAVGGGMLLAALFDNSVIGLTLLPLVSTLAFAAGLGYWVRNVVKKLSQTPTTFGSSRWATHEDLSHKKMFDKGGLYLGKSYNGKKEVDIYYKGDGHALVVSRTRGGKGVNIIVPNLLTYEGNIVVIDPKNENCAITAEQRVRMGQAVYRLAPFGAEKIDGVVDAKYNPLDLLKPGDIDMPENAMMLADAIILSEGNGEVFFTEEAKAVIHGVIGFVVTDDDEAGQRNLGRVRDLLLSDADDLKALFIKMMESPYHFIASTGARCLQKDPKLLSNVLATVQAQTHFLDSQQIRENTSSSDFSFEDLKTKKMTVYLCLPADRLHTFSRWLRLLIQQSITVNARNIEEKPEKAIMFILDEMAVLGKMPVIEQAYSLMAGFGIQMLGILQDINQLSTMVGKGWETIIANSAAITYFGTMDKTTAEYFSALCGETTVWNFSSAVSAAFGTSSGQGGFSSSKSITTTDTRGSSQRKLAYADELMRMEETKQLVFIENMYPLIARKSPWYEDPILKDLGVNLHDKSE